MNDASENTELPIETLRYLLEGKKSDIALLHKKLAQASQQVHAATQEGKDAVRLLKRAQIEVRALRAANDLLKFDMKALRREVDEQR